MTSSTPSAPFNERDAYEREQREGLATGTSAPGVTAPPPSHQQQQHETGAALFHEPPRKPDVPPMAQPQQQAPPPQQQQYHQAPPQQQAHHQQAPQYNTAESAQPLPGVPVRPPMQTPPTGYVITGYQLVQPTESCSCDLKLEGWMVVLILILLVPCVACIPCCIPSLFQSYQVPIYGPPGSSPASIPIATPVYN